MKVKICGSTGDYRMLAPHILLHHAQGGFSLGTISFPRLGKHLDIPRCRKAAAIAVGRLSFRIDPRISSRWICVSYIKVCIYITYRQKTDADTCLCTFLVKLIDAGIL